MGGVKTSMSGPIPQEFIDEVLARSDLVALIERRISLKKAGKDFTARCPFHDEKTPSFTVSPDKQFYHCFGCGAHGNAIGFLMAFDRLEFRDAVADLAAEAGLTLPAGGEAPPARHLELRSVLEAVARYFRQQLRGAESAIDYLKSRGLSGSTAATFGLGYAPARWDAVLQQFGATPEKRALLLDCGLIIPAREATAVFTTGSAIASSSRSGTAEAVSSASAAASWTTASPNTSIRRKHRCSTRARSSTACTKRAKPGGTCPGCWWSRAIWMC